MHSLSTELTNPITRFMLSSLFSVTSNPQIMVLYSRTGIWETVQGIPPILAQICIKILFQMDLRFFPFWMVLERTTCEGTGSSLSNSDFISLYKKLFLLPGNKSTTHSTFGFKLLFKISFQSSKNLDFT